MQVYKSTITKPERERMHEHTEQNPAVTELTRLHNALTELETIRIPELDIKPVDFNTRWNSIVQSGKLIDDTPFVESSIPKPGRPAEITMLAEGDITALIVTLCRPTGAFIEIDYVAAPGEEWELLRGTRVPPGTFPRIATSLREDLLKARVAWEDEES